MGREEQDQQAQYMEFEPKFQFDDLTILEADGNYDECLRIMNRDKVQRPWFLQSRLTLLHPFGVAEMRLQFTDTGGIDIINMFPSTSVYVSCYDLRCLAQWSAEKGWQKPQPTSFLIHENIDFWKHMWQVTSVDSPYLEKRYGKRFEDELNDKAKRK